MNRLAVDAVKGKYRPLFDYLFAKKATRVRLSFSEIEEIIDSELPKSASNYDEWWANEDPDSTRHVHCIAWQAAGYNAVVDRKSSVVCFEKH